MAYGIVHVYALYNEGRIYVFILYMITTVTTYVSMSYFFPFFVYVLWFRILTFEL